jgi:hypothetical protein
MRLRVSSRCAPFSRFRRTARTHAEALSPFGPHRVRWLRSPAATLSSERPAFHREGPRVRVFPPRVIFQCAAESSHRFEGYPHCDPINERLKSRDFDRRALCASGATISPSPLGPTKAPISERRCASSATLNVLGAFRARVGKGANGVGALEDFVCRRHGIGREKAARRSRFLTPRPSLASCGKFLRPP